MWIKLDNLQIDSGLVSKNIDAMLEKFLLKSLNMTAENLLSYRINSKSVDARRGTPLLIYSVWVELKNPLEKMPLNAVEVSADEIDKKYALNCKITPLIHFTSRPVVVGTGPAGIFAALILAQSGVKPLILDRGLPVRERMAEQVKFLADRILNEESNLLIGEGGAGTFSDGKLYTRVKDCESGFILKTFVESGAPEEILYLKRPHIGSDNLPQIAENLRKKIESLGGEFRFSAHVVDILLEHGEAVGVELSSGEKIYGHPVILAHGLGGRNLTRKLIERQVKYRLKGFQIGSRIEHPQLFIDCRQYRMEKRLESLPVAEYNFVSGKVPDLPGVSSFCMCPGGRIVMASAWSGQLCSNGMSNYQRDGEFANSCLIMTVNPERFSDAASAFSFLERYEKAAFAAGNSNYTMPAQSALAFLRRKDGLIRERSSSLTGITPGRLDLIFDEEFRKGMSFALKDFDKKCSGFIDGGQLTGIETSVSSPVTFLRGEKSISSSVNNLFIAGEGAGCAGGIMSAAIDGIRVAQEVLRH